MYAIVTPIAETCYEARFISTFAVQSQFFSPHFIIPSFERTHESGAAKKLHYILTSFLFSFHRIVFFWHESDVLFQIVCDMNGYAKFFFLARTECNSSFSSLIDAVHTFYNLIKTTIYNP